MALPRRRFLASLGVAAAGCTARDASRPTTSADGTPTPPPSPRTQPAYASCDPNRATTVELHTAGGIPDDLTKARAREYARALEKDIVLPPPEERTDGYLSIGDVTAEPVSYGHLVTVEVLGGYQREDPPGTATGTHADLGQHLATYFLNERVVRRAVERDAEGDPREYGEVVVCESG